MERVRHTTQVLTRVLTQVPSQTRTQAATPASNRRSLRLALLVASTCMAANAQSTELPPATLHEATALVQQAVKAIAPQGARVVVEAGQLDNRLKLAPCARITPYLPAGVQAWGRSRVGLRCTQGARWNVSLPVDVQIWAPAVVSRVALPAGAELSASQLQIANVDWAAAGSQPHAELESLLQRTLVRPLLAGQAIRSTDIQARRWFTQGETVKLIAAGTGFSIATEGRALSPGMEGQTVRVRTDSGRVVQGLAVGEREVEVRL